MRAGETLTEVLSKRRITESEFYALNPGVDIKSVKGKLLCVLGAVAYLCQTRNAAEQCC